MIELTDIPRIIVPTRGGAMNGKQVRISVGKGGNARLILSPQLFLELEEPGYVILLLSRTELIVRPGKQADTGARRVNQKMRSCGINDIASLFSLRPGERFGIDATITQTQAHAKLPGTFYTRYQYKNRGEKAA